MPKYFMHLRDGEDEVLDPDGTVMAEDAVPAAALAAARDCMAGDVRRGRIELKHRIDVCDEAGAIVYSLDFADAVDIVPASWLANLVRNPGSRVQDLADEMLKKRPIRRR
jgi:hypothetical protein